MISVLLLYLVLITSSAQGDQQDVSLLTAVNPVAALKQRYLRSQDLNDETLDLLTKFKSAEFFKKQNFSVNSTDPCVLSLLQLGSDLIHGKHQALLLADSWGKLESGLLRLDLTWMGRYFECLDSSTADYQSKYCFAHFGQAEASDFQLGASGLTIGNCFPDACSASNITSLFNGVIQNKTGVSVQCPEQFNGWEFKDVLGILVLVILGLLVLSASLYDYISKHHAPVQKDLDFTPLITNEVDQSPEPNGTGLRYFPRRKRLRLYDSFVKGLYYIAPGRSFLTEVMSTGKRIFLSFSAIDNTEKLMNTQRRPTDIHCLHGIRFISMSWVILGHSFAFLANYTDNIYFAARYLADHWEFQAIANGTFSVDSFFYLSGLLAAFLGMRELTRTGGKINVPLMYLHRYIRLTPAYAFCILMSVSLWPKFGEGPIWPNVVRPMISECQKYWWSNLLYINNLYPSNLQTECFAWSWYLANDTQFYLLLPLLLFLLYRYPVVGIAYTSVLYVASIAITGAFSSITEQQPQIIEIAAFTNYVLDPSRGGFPGNSSTAPQYSPYISDLYTKPWCRIGAYLVGVATGYILHVSKNKLQMPKVVAGIGWIVAAGINCSIIYGLYPSVSRGEFLNVNLAAFYNAITRPMWCVGLAWVTLACVSGYGGPVNALLSWKGFIPLSRLTYCCYLIHPMAIWWFFGTQEVLTHYSIPAVMMLFIGSLVMAHIFAFAVHLLIEAPIIGIMKILTGKDKPKPVSLPATVNLKDGYLVNDEEHHA